jgi:hypothetical protein
VGTLRVHPHKHYTNYSPQKDRGIAICRRVSCRSALIQSPEVASRLTSPQRRNEPEYRRRRPTETLSGHRSLRARTTPGLGSRRRRPWHAPQRFRPSIAVHVTADPIRRWAPAGSVRSTEAVARTLPSADTLSVQSVAPDTRRSVQVHERCERRIVARRTVIVPVTVKRRANPSAPDAPSLSTRRYDSSYKD